MGNEQGPLETLFAGKTLFGRPGKFSSMPPLFKNKTLKKVICGAFAAPGKILVRGHLHCRRVDTW